MKKAFAVVMMLLFAACAVSCAHENQIIDINVDSTSAPVTTEAPEGTETANTDPAGTATDAPAFTDAPAETTAPAVTDAPADPNLTPAPTAVPELPAGQALWLNTMPTDLYGVAPSEAEAWFSDAVFVGDSIMLGWKNYNNNMLASDPNFFGQTHFLCEGSYGAGHALEPVTSTSLHPLYQGQQQLLWDSIRMMGAKKVFICFGLNDVAIYGVEGTANNFRTLCDNIMQNSPDAKIYLISAMYLIDDSNMKALTNANLRELNRQLRALCDEKGYSFVDIASHLVKEDGYLKAEYCSDNYVHQTTEAYKVWAEVLRSVAAHDIKWGY